MTAKRHDHRQSIWAFVPKHGNAILWCYRCGAIRVDKEGEKWQKPVGLEGKNPALKERKADV